MGILDYLVPGYQVISNMALKWGLQIGDDLLTYNSQDLDKAALLKFDIERQSTVIIDEVNIEFSEARRAITNRNLIFNKIMQQLRKRELNVIYTVQHEMWIDTRLRWQTDMYIKCQDICLKPGGLFLPFDLGEILEWRIYDMRGWLNQGAYQETGEPITGWRFPGKPWFDTYDTLEIQGEDELTYGQSPHIKEQIDKWGWLDALVAGWNADGITDLTPDQLVRGLQTPLNKEIRDQLRIRGVVWNNSSQTYRIDDFNLERTPPPPKQMENIYG